MAEPNKVSSSASRNPTIRPSDLGGWIRQPGRHRGGIEGKAFQTRAKRLENFGQVRILCVLGTVDPPRGKAGPNQDGWLISDFYYLHHLFRDAAKRQHQLWLTSLRPEELVHRYGEYVQENPRSHDRCVVLDRLMLSTTKDIMVVPSNTLRERFLNEVEDWTNEAAALDQQVLIIMLGHGHFPGQSHRIMIGESDTTSAAPSPANSVSVQEFNQVCNPNVRATILTSACFSGAWAISPLLPNFSILSAQDDGTENLSWPKSTLGRHCGSRYFTDLTNVLIKMYLPDIEVEESEEDALENGRIGLWGPSIADLAQVVRDEMAKINTIHNPMSAAQNDEWYRYWQCLSGFRDVDIRAKLSELRSIPRSTAPELGYEEDKCRTGAGDEVFTLRQGLTVARARIEEYKRSKPGPHSAAKNIGLHGTIRDFEKGETEFSAKEVEDLLAALNYRLFDVMRQATIYRIILGINFPNCSDFDFYDWAVKRKQSESAAVLQEISSYAFLASIQAQLFDAPIGEEGEPFMKGYQYLGAMFAESRWSRARIDTALAQLVEWKSANGKHDGTVAVMDLSLQQQVRQRLLDLSARSGKRLRSISPKKSTQRLRASVESLYERGRDHLRRPRHQRTFSMHFPQPTLPESEAGSLQKQRGRSLTR